MARLKTENHDQKTGIDIVRKALNAPARQIAINAGEDDAIVVGKISENKSYVYGYDAQEGQYGDLVSKGIIDPTKVVRTALQGAASIAGLLMTTEAMVAREAQEGVTCHPCHAARRRHQKAKTLRQDQKARTISGPSFYFVMRPPIIVASS